MPSLRNVIAYEYTMSEASEIPVVKKEIKNTNQIPEKIVEKIEDYLKNGRPGLNGALMRGFGYSPENRTREPGSRSGLCGFAAPYAMEVIEEMRKDSPQIAARACQAELLGYSMYQIGVKKRPSFLRHGFNVVIDSEKSKWWILDSTLNQFLYQKEDGSLTFRVSGIKVDKDSDYHPSVVAGTILNNGFVEGSPENFAAYIALMGERHSPKLYERLKENFSNKEVLTNVLRELQKMHVKKNSAGDWINAVDELS